jgi:hypothetical protein
MHFLYKLNAAHPRQVNINQRSARRPHPVNQAHRLFNGSAPASAPVLTYVQAPRGARFCRWLRPGSPGFVILILLLAGTETWGGWKWRLREDEKAFDQCARIYNTGKVIRFTEPPTRAAVRHLARLSRPFTLELSCIVPSPTNSFDAFRGMPLANVQWLIVENPIVADLLLQGIVRPNTGLKALTILDLNDTSMTDAGPKELCRPDCGLKALERCMCGIRR